MRSQALVVFLLLVLTFGPVTVIGSTESKKHIAHSASNQSQHSVVFAGDGPSQQREGDPREAWLERRDLLKKKHARVADRQRPSSAAGNGAVLTPQTVTGALTLLSTKFFSDFVGDLVVVGEVQNATTSTLSFATVNFAFYNSLGGSVGTDYNFIYGSQNARLALSGIFTNVLPPGAIGFFKVWTSIPAADVSTYVFSSEAETYATTGSPFASLSLAGAITLVPNILGGTDFRLSVANGGTGGIAYFARAFLAGYSGGSINDVDFAYVNGTPITQCGVTTSTAINPGASAPIDDFFLRPVTQVSRIAFEWEEVAISPGAYNISAAGGNRSVFVFSNCSWSAISNASWITISSGASGSSDGTLNFSVASNLGATRTGTLSVAGFTVTVTQSAWVATSDAPFGAFDTPTNNTSNVVGAIPVTGWALDDFGVQKVQLWRNCIEAIDRPVGACAAAVPGGPANFVYIGDGAFLAGARPDVESAFSTYPQASRAGWGYLMLTNALPHLPPPSTPQGGQGTFTLSAYAVDMEGQFALLGTKTIALDNDHATIPFGAIDTPNQGGTVTVPIYANFGWAMTQNPKCIDTTTTASYRVYIDGVSLPLTPGTHWFPGLNRSDIAAAFPGRCNTTNALAAYYIDTNALGLTNGLHTTGWDVIDNQGNIAGIGSRFFNVLVGSVAAPARVTSDRALALGVASELGALAPAQRSVRVRVGPDDVPLEAVRPDSSGRYALQFPAGTRIALDLDGPVQAGYQIVGDELRALPGGSTFDAANGQLTWQPPVPFLGPFHLVFTRGGERLDVTATVADPTAPRDLALHIDTPAPNAVEHGAFVVAGWALDPRATTGSGIDTLHVWAYRRDAIAPPQFLGTAAVGGLRPDVEAIYGVQFEAAGFTLTVPPLAPGVYDLLVYPWAHRSGQFGSAATVRITIP